MEQNDYYEAKLKYEIDSWDLSESIKNNEAIIVIDARTMEAFKEQHIAGAINIPHRNMNESSTKHLLKTTLYVTYCDGIGCNASTKGALNMTKLGFKVKELMGGLDWWIRDGHNTEGEISQAEFDVSCGC